MVSHTRQDVRVGVKCYCYRGVAQQLLDELGVYTLRKQDRGARVAQVMEPYLREPCLREERLERALG